MTFPSISIQNYTGTPIPVVDRESGEMVAVLTNPADFSPNTPFASVTVIPDLTTVGLTTDDPRFDVVVGGYYIENTGFNYTNDVEIKVIDKDLDQENGKAKATVFDGRIINVEIINSGTRFKRIPFLEILDKTGSGALIYPVMNIVPNGNDGDDNPEYKPLPESVEYVFCQSKQLNNLY